MADVEKLESEANALAQKTAALRAKVQQEQAKRAAARREREAEYDAQVVEAYSEAKWRERLSEERQRFLEVLKKAPWFKAYAAYLGLYVTWFDRWTEANAAAVRVHGHRGDGGLDYFPGRLREPQELAKLLEAAAHDLAHEIAAEAQRAEDERRSRHIDGRKAEK